VVITSPFSHVGAHTVLRVFKHSYYDQEQAFHKIILLGKLNSDDKKEVLNGLRKLIIKSTGIEREDLDKIMVVQDCCYTDSKAVE
jgi:hypothetical protein